MRFPIQVVYEDNHIIAVNKPAGILSQGDITGDRTLIDDVKQYIKMRYDKPGDVFLGTIHRLDRPVSGVIIYARTSKGLERMNKLFHDKQVKKVYWALTQIRPQELSGKLEHYLLKDTERNVTRVYEQIGRRTSDAKWSTLTWELKGHYNQHTLLEVYPDTGRSHQIRAQLAYMGSPIRGDVKYGAEGAENDKNIFLHCRSMSFIHPIKNVPVMIKVDPPNKPEWQWFRGLYRD